MTVGNWQEVLLEAIQDRQCEVFLNEPLARHTSFRIGGPADALVIVNSRDSLIRLWRFASKFNLNFTVIGRGTNVLISDQGLRGLVVRLGGDFCRIELLKDDLVYAGAGVLLDAVADFAELHGLAGADFLAGIPGTVGGGLMSNAGAYGRSLGDIVYQVEIIDSEGNINSLTKEMLTNRYREPVIPAGGWVLSALFQLTPGRSRSCQEIRAERKGKHPSEPSAGSFFKNPRGFAAGRLIEESNLKGITLGGAAVSVQHGNFVVNRGGARFVDVYELIQIIKAAVEERTGMELDEEVRILPHSVSTGERGGD